MSARLGCGTAEDLNCSLAAAAKGRADAVDTAELKYIIGTQVRLRVGAVADLRLLCAMCCGPHVLCRVLLCARARYVVGLQLGEGPSVLAEAASLLSPNGELLCD